MTLLRPASIPVLLTGLVASLLVLVPAGSSSALTGAATTTVGRPSRGYVIPAGSYFSYPNRSSAERMAIRNRVLYTIQSTWGGARDPRTGVPLASNGKIRIATWTLKDWAVAKALVAARNRGVSVQVMVAASANRDSGPWKYLRKHLGGYLYKPGYPSTAEQYSFARQCRGACRGRGGTAHAKYFLFTNVGSGHTRNVVVNTSMNLTRFAYTGQWNQAQVLHSSTVYSDFLSVFRQARLGRAVSNPYHVRNTGNVQDLFFPLPGARAASDPVMKLLRPVVCRSSTGRTRIRVVQYAVYGNRGTWIAKRLRYLWNHGCDVKIIYSVSSRPVLGVLRSKAGRGPVPMRQSVVKNGAGEIVKYNHSKWMTITGRYGSGTAYLTFTGSANWADLAFTSDEQMQRVSGRTYAARHLTTFAKTWKQKTSKVPPSGRVYTSGRSLPGIPEDAPAFGQGVYRYLTED